jgi:RNA polymerase sigma-70 factor (ECF subfamily)
MSQVEDSKFEELEELFRKAQEGDKEAYGQFLREIYPFIKYKIQQTLGGLIDCDDVTQECLIGIHHSMETYDPGKKLKPWISGVIQHKVADYFRLLAKRKETEVQEKDIPVTKPDFHTNIDVEREARERVWCVIEKLPDPQKRALVLTKISGLSYEEASLKEGISEAFINCFNYPLGL